MPTPSDANLDRLARSLGWVSLAIGAAELAAPAALARAVGLPERPRMLWAYGAREIAAGAGILISEDPTPWLWARVAGDAVDLATLAWGFRSGRARPARLTASLAATAAITALDAFCASRAGRQDTPPPDYSDRSGFPRGAERMRGAART